METEVICISSDDESDSQKENKTDTFLTNSTEANRVLAHEKTEKTEILFNKNVEEKYLKRKLSHEEKKEITYNNIEKRQKLNVNEDTKEICKPDQCSDVSEIRVKCNYNIQSYKDQEATEKTQLIVKEKKRISYISEDVFPSFISLCLQKCPKYDKKEMNIIVDKLKRRYEDLDPIYARSDNFVRFLNEKREVIVNDNKKIYVHIKEVMNEMKKRIEKKVKVLQVNDIYDAIPSTSYATNNIIVSNTVKSDNDDNEDDEETVSRGTREKIRQISRAMKKCEAMIRKLEEEEVDFDEENDSNYIKVERYKQKMVELYNKLCELTGENADAGRPYLRPKHLNVTRIVAVDQAITNFINSKITRRNKMKMAGALTDNLIFPDYRDILECVDRCNNKKNLGLDEKRRKQMAEKAFKELGEHLQRTRRNDYWDTFSLYLENTEDPAIKDENLARKLAENRTEGEKRLAAVFEKYVIKQYEMKDQDNEETTSEKEEDEIEDEGEDDASIIDDENKNETNSSSVITSESSGDEESISKTENLPMEKSKSNINTVNVSHSMDKAISNKIIADILHEKCNKTVKIIIDKESKATVSKNENKTIDENLVDKSCSSNTVLRKDVVKDVDIKTRENLLPAASTINCTKDLTEAKTKDVSKVITDSATKKVARDMPDITTMVPTDNKNVARLVTEDTAGLITGDTAQPITEDTAQPITEDTAQPITEDTAQPITEDTAQPITEDTAQPITEDTAELITGDITETLMENSVEVIMENVIDGAIENMPNDEQPGEEKKPVLRVRSFAKPPTTWEDNQHKTDKIAQGNAPKVTNQIKEVVDLTKEGMAKPSVATKCVIQLGNKIIPLVKRHTMVIPANKNIISVQNITNNYLKVNPQTGKIIAPIRNIPGPTVIRLRANETTSRQDQLQNANTVRNEVILKRKELFQIIPKESIKIIPKKLAVQSVSKQTDASSSLAKSK